MAYTYIHISISFSYCAHLIYFCTCTQNCNKS